MVLLHGHSPCPPQADTQHWTEYLECLLGLKSSVLKGGYGAFHLENGRHMVTHKKWGHGPLFGHEPPVEIQGSSGNTGFFKS